MTAFVAILYGLLDSHYLFAFHREFVHSLSLNCRKNYISGAGIMYLRGENLCIVYYSNKMQRSILSSHNVA